MNTQVKATLKNTHLKTFEALTTEEMAINEREGVHSGGVFPARTKITVHEYIDEYGHDFRFTIEALPGFSDYIGREEFELIDGSLAPTVSATLLDDIIFKDGDGEMVKVVCGTALEGYITDEGTLIVSLPGSSYALQREEFTQVRAA